MRQKVSAIAVLTYVGLIALLWTGSQSIGATATQAEGSEPTRSDKCDFVGGVPLGGLGTGTVEVRGDGSFRQWQIFNNWGNTPSVNLHKYVPSFDLLNAFAAVRIDNSAFLLETHPVEGLPGVTRIAYDGWFPFADLKYGLGKEAPVEISLEAFGSYSPHHASDSGIPAFGLTWRFKNTSAKPVRISLALSIVNPTGSVCRDEISGRLRVAESVRESEGVALAALDDQAVSVTGGTDTPETLKAFWREFTGPQPTFSSSSGDGQRAAQVVTFLLQPNESKSERFVIGWFFPNHKENGNGPLVGHQYEAWTASPIDSVNLFAKRFDDLRAASAQWRDTLRNASWPTWISHWLCNNQYTIAKFTWWTKDGRFMSYESPECPNGSPAHIFDLADWPVVDEFPELELRLLRHFAEHQSKQGGIPEEFHVEGKGLGTQPSITFPGGRDLIDINPKFAVEIYHRWRETGDQTFLNDTWPSVKRAILYNKKFDSMGVGLPSGANLSSTWDHWNDKYLFSYGASVWLAGLRAAEELAKVQGDPAFATQMHAMYETGVAAMNDHLWNGEFYSMATDKELRQNDLCFVESSYGDIFGRLVGLGSILPDDKSLSNLRAIARYNNKPTRWGLVVSANKSGEMVEYQGDKRSQITVCHSIPAPIALIHQGHGEDVENGLRILKQMYDLGDKHPGGLWNLPHHVVAATGERNVHDFGHYMRDRSLWALLKVLNGWSYNAPDQSLDVGPLLEPEKCHGPWICSKAYGTLTQEVTGKRQTLFLRVSEGTLTLKEINVRCQTGVAGSLTAAREGKAVGAEFLQKGNCVKAKFGEAVNLQAGNALEIVIEGDRVPSSRESGR